MKKNEYSTVAFDVDGTLIYQVGEKEDKPKYEVIDLFRIFERLGFNMYIWSGGGIDYATIKRDNLGLTADVVAKGSFTPDIAVDDEKVKLGKVNIQV